MSTAEFTGETFPRDHTGLVVLGLDECLMRLASTPIGRVAFRLDGGITVLPVAHVVDGVDVCFRTAGPSKIQAALDGDEVAFQADAFDAGERSGWSVLVQGQAVVVTDAAEIRALEERADAPWVDLPDQGTRWIRVRAESVSGRELLAGH